MLRRYHGRLGTAVIEFVRTILVYKRAYRPAVPAGRVPDSPDESLGLRG
jgi:hypothetical protein